MGTMQRLRVCSDPARGLCQSPQPVTRTDPVYFVGGVLDGSVETYVPIDDSGRGQTAEVMRYSWFSTDGNFDDERTGDSHPQTKWQNGTKRPAPAATSLIDLWFVAQDDRGGTAYQRYQLTLGN
jgi:hypothetical protein